MTRGRNVFLIRGGTSFVNMKRGQNVFPNYEMGAKHLSEIWFEFETSLRNMARMGRNVSLNNGAN